MSDYETELYDYRHEVDGKTGILTQCYESGSLWVSDDQNDFRFLDGVYPKGKAMSASISGTYDSAHLPECRILIPCTEWEPRHTSEMSCQDCGRSCCCDAVRACEQRVREEIDREAFVLDEGDPFRQAYRKGLDAAREAVAAVPPIDQRVDDNGLVSLVYDKGDALAAIDALRGVS